MEKDDKWKTDSIAYLSPGSAGWRSLDKNTYELLSRFSNDQINLSDNDPSAVESNKKALQETLLSALKQQNLIFLSGSGTSLGEPNGPSMWDLWRYCMWENPNAKKGDEKYALLSEKAGEVCEKVKYEEFEKPNIERFLSNCEAFLLFNDDDEVKKIVNEAKGVILKHCSQFIYEKDSSIDAHHTLIQKLARRRARDPRLKVFTTNYDMCFEKAASDLGVMVIDGFSYTYMRKFDARNFDYDVVRREKDNHEFVEGVFQLYKLHGSVSWVRNGGMIYESDSASPENVVLIYPASGKYQQAFIQPHLEIFARFLESVRKPNTCLLVSGFGFNDDHLAEPILSAIKSNPSLKLIVVDKCLIGHLEGGESATSSRYWSELKAISEKNGDVHLINADFSNFSKLIPNLSALSPAEELYRTITALK